MTDLSRSRVFAKKIELPEDYRIIDPDLALRFRKRGWLLPVDALLSIPRLVEIAKRQAELMDEMNTLDKELLTLVSVD